MPVRGWERNGSCTIKEVKGAEGKPQLSSRRRNWAPGNLKDFPEMPSTWSVEGNLGVLIFSTHCGESVWLGCTIRRLAGDFWQRCWR